MEKKNLVAVFTTWTVLSIASTFCYGQSGKRVLFLGNSVWDFIEGVHQPFLGFCETGGLDFQAVSQMRRHENGGGFELRDFGWIPLSLPEVAGDKRSLSLIRSCGYDYVIAETFTFD
jgi:hypothetical protein